MSEYRYILSLYQKHKHYQRNLILFSLVMLGLAGIFVGLNLVRVSPLIIFSIGMALTLYYSIRTRVESKNYPQLKKYLQENAPELLQNDEFVFFIDYQLENYFQKESTELIMDLQDEVAWNDAAAKENLAKIIGEIKNYYDYVSADQSLEEDIALSLKWYRESSENRKRDLV